MSSELAARPRGRWARRVFIGGAIVVGGGVTLLIGMSWMSSSQTETSAAAPTQLAACPDKPNCVSTIAAEHPDRKMPPLRYEGSTAEALEKLKSVVRSMPRTRIVTESERFLHVEFKSLVFRFVDDVQFLVDPEQRLIHFRSASRVGHSDLGANRKRMTTIRAKFQQPR